MYLMAYFTDKDEALHLAVSQDGRRFNALNEGRPVLHSTVGARRLRDPFIGRGPDGLFHLLATNGWTSPCILHAASADLRTWSPQSLIPVMVGVAGAHNAWAPEFFFDPLASQYHLIWSSVVEPHAPAEGRDWQNVSQDNRIWHCTTRDFASYSPPALFFDPGYSVIDATVTRHDGRFLMAFKDERGSNDPATDHKHILVTTFERPGGPFSEPAGPVSPALAEGPSFFRREREWVLLFDHFTEGRYGAAASADGLNWKPCQVWTPAGARHASVLDMAEVPVPLSSGVPE